PARRDPGVEPLAAPNRPGCVAGVPLAVVRRLAAGGPARHRFRQRRLGALDDDDRGQLPGCRRTLAYLARRGGPLQSRRTEPDRGGASFPVGRKWRTVAERSGGRATVLVNGAEGEPLSAKDRVLMALRPHLVLDGALLAAGAVGAEEIVVYVGAAHTAARRSLERAIGERSATAPSPPAIPTRLVVAPDRYVDGEES